jgi:hypothetical protein
MTYKRLRWRKLRDGSLVSVGGKFDIAQTPRGAWVLHRMPISPHPRPLLCKGTLKECKEEAQNRDIGFALYKGDFS